MGVCVWVNFLGEVGGCWCLVELGELVVGVGERVLYLCLVVGE